MPNLALPTGGGNQLWETWPTTGAGGCSDTSGRGTRGSSERRPAGLGQRGELPRRARGRAPGTRPSRRGRAPRTLALTGLHVGDHRGARGERLRGARRGLPEHAGRSPSTRLRWRSSSTACVERGAGLLRHSQPGWAGTRALLAREGDAWRARHRLGRAVHIAAHTAALPWRASGRSCPGRSRCTENPARRWRAAWRRRSRSALPFLDVAAARGTEEGGTLVPGDDDGVVGVEETRLKERRRASSCAGRTFVMRDPRSSGPRWSSCSPTDEELFLGGVKAPQPHGGSRLPRSRQSAAPRVHERAALARAR